MAREGRGRKNCKACGIKSLNLIKNAVELSPSLLLTPSLSPLSLPGGTPKGRGCSSNFLGVKNAVLVSIDTRPRMPLSRMSTTDRFIFNTEYSIFYSGFSKECYTCESYISWEDCLKSNKFHECEKLYSAIPAVEMVCVSAVRSILRTWNQQIVHYSKFCAPKV